MDRKQIERNFKSLSQKEKLVEERKLLEVAAFIQEKLKLAGRLEEDFEIKFLEFEYDNFFKEYKVYISFKFKAERKFLFFKKKKIIMALMKLKRESVIFAVMRELWQFGHYYDLENSDHKVKFLYELYC